MNRVKRNRIKTDSFKDEELIPHIIIRCSSSIVKKFARIIEVRCSLWAIRKARHNLLLRRVGCIEAHKYPRLFDCGCTTIVAHEIGIDGIIDIVYKSSIPNCIQLIFENFESWLSVILSSRLFLQFVFILKTLKGKREIILQDRSKCYSSKIRMAFSNILLGLNLMYSLICLHRAKV